MLRKIVINEKKIAFRTGRCDACGDGFHFPSWLSGFDLTTARINDFPIDIGGLCPSCGRQVCQRHAKWVATADLPTKAKCWKICCSECHFPLLGFGESPNDFMREYWKSFQVQLEENLRRAPKLRLTKIRK
jgi:hypothetical protein